MFKSNTIYAALLIVAATEAVMFSAQPRMPVVPSDDIIEFKWDDFAFERPQSKVVDLLLLPEKVRALQGQRIRVRGYMMPSFKQDGIDRFILESQPEMRFRSGQPIDEVIFATMIEGKTATFTWRPVIVEGTLSMDDWLFNEKGEVILIYRLAANSFEFVYPSPPYR
jgi:hypothetical protein